MSSGLESNNRIMGYLRELEKDKLSNTLKWLSNSINRPKPQPASEAANFITQNAIMTPDSTYLVSSSNHDYQAHTDSNGVLYSVDGGYEECTWSNGNGQEECLRLSSDDQFLEVREKLLWGSYGKSGKEPLHHIRLKDMEEDHIANVIEYLNAHHVGSPVAKWRIEMMREELKYRKIKLIGE